MRIVYVLTSLGVGGAERQALALAARMAERGHSAAVLVLRPPLAEQWSTSVEVVYLGMRKNPASLAAALMRARRFLREFNPDLVHSHSFHANIFARLLKILLPRLVVLATIQNVWEGGWTRLLAYRLSDGLARRTTVVGRGVMDRFVRLKAVSPHRCVVMANGVDTVEFAPSAARRGAMRTEMGIGGEFVWLTVGRLAPAKDYPNLLRAFRGVVDVRPGAQLWVAGGGPAGALQALAAELGLGEAVRWLGLRRDLPALLDAADGFVLGSAWEGMPVAIAEAMAMEKAVVATDVGSVRELMADTGLLAPAKSPGALTSAMLEVMRQSPESRQAWGRSARHRVVREFGIEAEADAWEALYRAIAEGR